MAELVPTELTKDLNAREFTLVENGQKFTFKWKPLGWYQEEKIVNDCMKIDPATRNISLDTAELNKRLLLACLKEAPFPITQDNILSLKPEIKQKLIDEISPTRLTEDTEKK